MADKTGIEWTDATWNPLRGCSRVSEGCRNCYAEGVASRFSGPGLPYEGLIAKGGQWNGQIKLVPELLDQPLRWRKPRLIFVNSMSDLFHENVPDEFIAKVFNVMHLAKQHTFQVLTKRPERMREFLAKCGNGGGLGWITHDNTPPADAYDGTGIVVGREGHWPLPNVWLGVSVEDQTTADERIPLLQDTPAAVRWISAEPLLGPVDLKAISFTAAPGLFGDALDWHHMPHCYEREGRKYPGLDWVVVGGESGPHARSMHPEWSRSLRDQCAEAGVPFLFKQWGEWMPMSRDEGDHIPNSGYIHPTLPRGRLPRPEGAQLGCHSPLELERLGCAFVAKVGKKAAGRLLDGVQHDGYPEVAA